MFRKCLLFLIVLFLASCNAKKEIPINCIQEIKIINSATPNPPGVIAKLIIEDKELRNILQEYRIKKPVVKYCGSIFSETIFHYSEAKISNDSSKYFTLGSMISLKSFQNSTVSQANSILQSNIATVYILITYDNKQWKIFPCNHP
jgi:hypothetical protein